MSITIAIFLLVTGNLVLASEDRHDIGRSFYIPDADMLDVLSGGSQILQSSMDKCIKEVDDAKNKRSFLFYEDQKSFYHSMRTEVGIGGDLMNAFTMGATLNAVSGSSGFINTVIKGATLDIASYSRQKYIDMDCIHESELAQKVQYDFERLPATIDRPEQKNSWIAYHTFLKNYGSHFVQKVFYGSRINQYVFSKYSSEYDSHEFNIKACEKFEGPTNIGKLGISLCQGYNQSDTKAVKNMYVNAKLVLRGGENETRAALSIKRTKELIERFLNEADKSKQPISYTYLPIWTLLKGIYLYSTDHLRKAVNLENYYKGYLNFGCPLQSINNHVVQKFQLAKDPGTLPGYQCVIAPTGCHQNDDCQYRDAFWCQCKGDTCINYSNKLQYDTGSTRDIPYAFVEDGWGWQGCVVDSVFTRTCSCTDQNKNWKTIWEYNEESYNDLMIYSHSSKSGNATKDEL